MAAKEANYTFSGITIPETDHDLYTLSYEQFVVPLVKAVQEQQLIIESLQEEAIAMRAEIADQKLTTCASKTSNYKLMHC